MPCVRKLQFRHVRQPVERAFADDRQPYRSAAMPPLRAGLRLFVHLIVVCTSRFAKLRIKSIEPRIAQRAPRPQQNQIPFTSFVVFVAPLAIQKGEEPRKTRKTRKRRTRKNKNSIRKNSSCGWMAGSGARDWFTVA